MSAGRLAAALANRYTITRELGAGGMATVYLAEDVKHHRQVAIKVLKPELAAVIGAERFVREIRTIATLQHPHILGLIDSGEIHGTAYYVMPYVEGESLRDRLQRDKQLPIADAARIATEVASALDYAHRHGVIHRDIKPENILLHDGSALVADFGIALAASSAGTRMTETGMSLGTPQYMSPEQAMGERDISAASDVYALGCVTYEMLIGEPPFTGATAQAIVAKVMTEEPKSLVNQRRSVPRHVDAAVHQALQKLPADRFATTANFAQALADERFTGSGAAARIAPAPAHFWKPLSVAALAVAAVAIALLLQARRHPAAAIAISPWRVTLALGDSVTAGNYGPFDLSPDGNSIVYVGGGPQGPQLWLRDAGSLSAIPIPGTNLHPYAPSVSPDGRWIAFYNNNSTLYVVPRDGSTPPVVVTRTNRVTQTTWADNKHIIIATDSGMISVSTNGGTPRQVTTIDTARGELLHSRADALPGGAGIVFGVTRGDPKSDHMPINANVYEIAVSDPATGRHTILMPGFFPRYAPPGYLLVQADASGSLVAVPFDPVRRRLTGPAVPLPGVDAGPFAVAGGRIVFQPHTTTQIEEYRVVRVTRSGSATPVDTAWTGWFYSVAASRDGDRIAAATLFDSIAIRNVANGSTTIIATPEGIAQTIDFSPDGALVFGSSSPFGKGPATSGIFRVTPGTTTPAERLVRSNGYSVEAPRVSGDGRTLYYTRTDSADKSLIFTHSLDHPGTPDRSVDSATPGWTPAPSPDGRWLAYRSTASPYDIWVRSTDPSRTERWQVSQRGGSQPRWSGDGRQLFYLGHDSLRVASVSTGAAFGVVSRRALFSTSAFKIAGTVMAYAVLPGDTTFLFLERANTSAASLTLVMLDDWRSALPDSLRRHE